MRLSQNENATSSVFMFSLCSAPFRLFFDYQTLTHVNNSIWLTEEMCLVTLIVSEVSSSALRFFDCWCHYNEDSAFHYVSPKKSSRSEESTTVPHSQPVQPCSCAFLNARCKYLYYLVTCCQYLIC